MGDQEKEYSKNVKYYHEEYERIGRKFGEKFFKCTSKNWGKLKVWVRNLIQKLN